MSNQESKDPGTPNWIRFLFIAPLVGGLLYAIFYHGFLAPTPDTQYRQSAGLMAFQAAGKIDITPIPARSAAAVEKGAATYKTVCSACHGANLEGVIGPNLSDAAWLHGKTKESELITLVIKGIGSAEAKQPAKTPMPSRGNGALTNEQLWEVVYFIQSKNPSVVKDAESAGK